MVPTAGASAAQPPRMSLASIVAVLVCLSGLALLFEITLVDLDHSARHVWTTASNAIATTTDDDNEDNVKDRIVEPGSEWLHAGADKVAVPPGDLLHLSMLQAACLEHKDPIIPWTFGEPGLDQEVDPINQERLVHENDPNLLEKLRACPAVDIYMPHGLRSHGYCEDATAYAKYLNSRLLPRWALDKPLYDPVLKRDVTYFELCPQTPLLFFNHYLDGVPELPSWPKEKPVYLMPNIEMYELNEKFYWNVDAVLCKTRVCKDRITKWYKQEGNPRNTKVFYTKHTTSDVANFAKHALGADTIKPKDFMNVKFIHTAGTRWSSNAAPCSPLFPLVISVQKGTRQVIDCWLSRPDFPQLDLYINPDTYTWLVGDDNPRVRAAKHINLSTSRLDPLTFGKNIAEASFFLCTSVMEGYGHYINQARASGGVIVTSNGPPMNELIASSDMGVYVDTQRGKDRNMFLGGASTAAHALKDVDGLKAVVSGDNICRAVEQVVFGTTVWQREAMAATAKRQYHIDTAYFGRAMQRLARFADKNNKQRQALQKRLRQAESAP